MTFIYLSSMVKKEGDKRCAVAAHVIPTEIDGFLRIDGYASGDSSINKLKTLNKTLHIQHRCNRKKPEVAYAFYDQRFYGPMGCAISPEAAIACAKKCLAKLSKEKNLVCKKKASENLFNEILNGRANADNTKNLWLTPLPLVHPDNPDSDKDTDVLFVMVYRNVY